MTAIVDLSHWSYLLNPNQYDLQVGGLDYYVENADRTYSLTPASSTVARFQVDGGDRWSSDPSTKNRSEISGLTHYAPGAHIDVTYGFKIEPGQANTASWLVTGQFHQIENNGYSPPFEINFNGSDHMGIAVNYLTSSGAQAYKELWTDKSSIVRGHNYQMQIEATFDRGAGAGHLVVIRDGVTLVNYYGPMGFPGMSGVYWKEGIYRSASGTTMAADYSNLSIKTVAAAQVATQAALPAPTSTIDTVQSSASHSLASPTTHSLASTSSANLTANDANHVLMSGAGVDSLAGGTGGDTLYLLGLHANNLSATGHHIM